MPVIGSALLAALAAGLYSWGTFEVPGDLDLLGRATLVVNAVLVVGLPVAAVAILIRRTPALVALGAFLAAALAGCCSAPLLSARGSRRRFRAATPSRAAFVCGLIGWFTGRPVRL